MKNMKEALDENPTVIANNIKVPVLILQGKVADDAPADASSSIDKALTDGGNQNHVVRYYGYLDHFMGKKINDGIHAAYYDADKDMLKNVKAWLESNMAATDRPGE